jgi:AraC-like DNA-binding protein
MVPKNKAILADGRNYFGTGGFPLTVVRIQGEAPDTLPDLTEVEHYHDFSELMIITRGHGMHRVGELDYAVAAGDVFLVQGQQTHFFYARQNMCHTNIMFDPQRLTLPTNELRKIPGYHALFILEPNYRRQHHFDSRLHLGPVALGHAEWLAESMSRELRDRQPGYESALLGKLLELIVYLSRQYSHTRTPSGKALLRVGQVMGELESQYARNWKLRDLAGLAHMSESNLLRVFREATGQTPIDYLMRLRLKHAMRLLRETDYPVSDIASQVGFPDSNYFARQFRRVVASSPREYRRAQQMPAGASAAGRE